MALSLHKNRRQTARWLVIVAISAVLTLSVFRVFAAFTDQESKEASLVISKSLNVILELNRLVYVKGDDKDLQLVFDPASKAAKGAKDYCVKVNYAAPLNIDFKVEGANGESKAFQLENSKDKNRLNIDVGVENVIGGASGSNKPLSPGVAHVLDVGGADFDCGSQMTTRLNVSSNLADQTFTAGIYRTTLKLTFAAK